MQTKKEKMVVSPTVRSAPKIILKSGLIKSQKLVYDTQSGSALGGTSRGKSIWPIWMESYVLTVAYQTGVC